MYHYDNWTIWQSLEWTGIIHSLLLFVYLQKIEGNTGKTEEVWNTSWQPEHALKVMSLKMLYVYMLFFPPSAIL